MIDFKITTDIKEAKTVWEKFSPHKSIDDEWDFRYSFIKELGYPLYFIAGYDGEEVIGLLPLQQNTLQGLMPPYYPNDNKPFLEFFGGDDTDDNTIFLKPGYESVASLFLDQVQQRVYLAPLKEQIIYKADHAQEHASKYVLDITPYTDYEGYIDANWQGESRNKFRRNIRTLYKRHTITVEENKYDSLEQLFQLNLLRYGNKSSFTHSYRQQIFRDFIDILDVVLLTIMVDNKIQAVSYAIKYKDAYVAMNMGVNTEINNLGKLLILLQINKAIALGCKTYDAGKGESGWKEAFHFTKIPQFFLTLA